jgi:hypothetical protein
LLLNSSAVLALSVGAAARVVHPRAAAVAEAGFELC